MVGSNPRCDLTIEDPGVDPEQCLVIARGESVEIIDIGATGGVLLNGKPVRHAVLDGGDEVWVGGTVFSVVGSDEEAVSFTESVSTVRAELDTKQEGAGAATKPRPQRSVGEPVLRTRKPAKAADTQGQVFALLHQVQRLIQSIGTNENIFEAILDTVFATVPVRRAFIGLLRPAGDLSIKAHRSREVGHTAGERIEVSRTLVGRVIESGRAVLTSDAEADGDFSAVQSIQRLRIKAALCVPLVIEDKVIGILYGDNREKPGSLTRDHLSIVSALSSVAAVAVEQFRLLDEYNAKVKIDQALAIAQSIQRNFLPDRPPAIAGLDVWGQSDSCDETGGDYFDYFTLKDGALRVVIADVTGHGVGPALLMASARSALRVLVDAEPDLEKLADRLNNLIASDVNDGRFITLFIGDMTPTSFRPLGAGHTPPIWFRATSRTFHHVASLGPPLGILPGIHYRCGTTLPVVSGDVICFSTDGIMEAMNGARELFGIERIEQVIARHAGESAATIGEAILSAVDDYVQGTPLHDDATLVIVKIL